MNLLPYLSWRGAERHGHPRLLVGHICLFVDCHAHLRRARNDKPGAFIGHVAASMSEWVSTEGRSWI